MQLSPDLRERLVRTATAAGVALALALVALASPTPAVAADGASTPLAPLSPSATARHG
ncbi:MAG: hypothetical protein ACN6O8_25245 [Achromobacter sp.]|uniref:hypothetical protein n=1 Tax=Achromobacter sp. TaxID=134375 RepID=UPI003D0941B6